MSAEPEPIHAESGAWRADRPRVRLYQLVVSWLATGIAFMVAAGLLPGVGIEGFWGALLVAALVAVLNAVIPPVLAALRLPLTLVLGFLLVLFADAGILLLTDALTDGVLTVDGFGWALLTSLIVAAVSVVHRRPSRHGRHVLDPHRPADRPPPGHHRRDRRPGHRLPRDRRARAARAAARDA